MATGITLSDKYCDTANPSERHWDSKLAGFFLECGKATKTFYVESKGKRTNLGRYPEISTKDAREKAVKAMAGTVEPERVSKAPTLQQALDHYLQRDKLRSDHNKAGVRRQMEVHCKKFLSTRLDTIDFKDVELLFRQVSVAREGIDALGRPCVIGGTRAANHVMQSFRTVYNHAKKRMYRHLPDCPTSAIEMHDEAKDEVEIITDLDMWRKEVAAIINPLHRAFYRLLLTTGMRKTECLSLTWDQVLEDRIHLPASVTKNGRPFDIPLEPEHVAILRDCRTGHGEPWHPKWVFPSERGDMHLKVPTPINWSAQLHRATFATKAHEAGLAPWQVGQLLNHTIPGVTSAHYIAKNVEHTRPFMRTVLDALPV